LEGFLPGPARLDRYLAKERQRAASKGLFVFQSPNQKHTMKRIAILFFACTLTYLAVAQTDPAVRKQQFNLEKGVAIQGYDPVAYFTQNKAVKGSAANAFVYKSVTYQFASPANLALFQKSPEKYEPQYGGWCAYAMGATGEKVEIDPETFKISGGKLFLFYHSFINNTLPKWNKDEQNLHKKADASWDKIVRSAS
jgi:YHS domain-containing protein